MTNIPDLFEYRAGIEATDAYGTAVAQSFKLMDLTEVELVPLVQSMQVKDRRGTLAPGYSTIHQKTSAQANVSGYLNIQQSPYWFNAFLQDVDPSSDAEGNTWNWAAPADTDGTDITSLTIAKGIAADADTVKSIRGAVINQMTLSGAVNEPVELSMTMIGLSVDTDTFDSAAEANVDTTILTGCGVEIWIDPDSDAVGTTQITNTGFDFRLNLNANRNTYGHLGSCVDDSFAGQRFEGDLTLGLELNSTSAAYIDSILGTSSNGAMKKVVRLKMTSDTSYVQIDFNGVALEAPQLYPDRDGISTISLTLNGQYGSVLGNWLKVEAQNAVEAF